MRILKSIKNLFDHLMHVCMSFLLSLCRFERFKPHFTLKRLEYKLALNLPLKYSSKRFAHTNYALTSKLEI